VSTTIIEVSEIKASAVEIGSRGVRKALTPPGLVRSSGLEPAGIWMSEPDSAASASSRLLRHVKSAIDVKRMAGDILASIGCQVKASFGNVLHLAHVT